MKNRIAVIGTGIMGSGIATNYRKNGYDVFVWNRTEDKCLPLIDLGARFVSTPKEAAEQADIVFEVTANDESSKVVWTSDDGIITGANKKKTLITCATLSASWVDELAGLCKKEGYSFFDMPMTGGRIAAETGTLTLLVGGDKKKLDAIKSDLAAISNTIHYFGPVGSGMRYKLILNMLQAIHIAGLGEALRLAQSAGLDIKSVGDALAQRPGGTTTNLAWRDYQKEPNPINFSIEWITKDLRYAKKLSQTLHTPFLDEALKKYESALKKHIGQKDWTVINKID